MNIVTVTYDKDGARKIWYRELAIRKVSRTTERAKNG